MKNPSRRLIAIAVPLAIAAAVPATASAATAFYGVTENNRLAEFQSDNTTGAPSLPIRGLLSGDRIVGLDMRPADGRLYGLTNTSRLVVFNPRNAAATYVDTTGFSPALTGDRTGFDFNPVVDRIRVETNAGQDLRLDPNTGKLSAVDTNLSYVAGDPGAGTVPQATATGYSNSFPIGTTTELFALDAARKTLVKQDPPNDGVLKTIGALGTTGDPVALDIAEDNVAYAAITTAAGGGEVGIYKVNLQTGAATPSVTTNVVGTSQKIVALAAAGTIDNDTRKPSLSIASSTVQLKSRLRASGLEASINSDEAVTGEMRVSYNDRTVGTVPISIEGGAGKDRVAVKLSSSVKSAMDRSGGILLKLDIKIADGAGNSVSALRLVRTR